MATIVTGLTMPGTDPLFMIEIVSATRREAMGQAALPFQSPSKGRSYFQVAQTMRASRLAFAVEGPSTQSIERFTGSFGAMRGKQSGTSAVYEESA